MLRRFILFALFMLFTGALKEDVNLICTDAGSNLASELVLVSFEPPVVDSQTFTVTPIEESTEVEEIAPTVNSECQGVLIPSNLTSAELERGLLYSLKECAPAFIEAEKQTGINAVFLASVAALESGWAESNLSNTHNNLFGWTLSSGFMQFDSKEECILYVASRIKELYLTEDGMYFNGYEVSDINICYNGRQHWEDSVNSIMYDINYRIEEDYNA